MKSLGSSLFLCVLVAATACNDNSQSQPNNSSAAPATPEKKEIHLIIDTSDKMLTVMKGTDTVNKYAIAVGMSKYPTPIGEFKIHRIDWNPDWTPPDGKWAENKEYEKPGSRENPMGRARIVYQMPYTIHGTRDLNSLGEAESHGSVRMANADVIALAKFLMKESRTDKGEDWYSKVLADSTEMVSVKLTDSIRLTNRQ